MAEGSATRDAVAEVTGLAHAGSTRTPNAAARSTADLPRPAFPTRTLMLAPALADPLQAAVCQRKRRKVDDSAA
ncbi:hypothetical protein GCM10028775_27010 [Catellatospora paridis]